MFCPDPFGDKELTLTDLSAEDFKICKDLVRNIVISTSA